MRENEDNIKGKVWEKIEEKSESYNLCLMQKAVPFCWSAVLGKDCQLMRMKYVQKVQMADPRIFWSVPTVEVKMGWCGLWGDSSMKRRNEEWHLKWEEIENNHSACLMCCFWSVREGVLLMVNLASYYGLNLSLLIMRGGQLIKLNDPDIISQLKGTVIQFDIDLCEAHIVNRRPRLNRVFWSRWYSQRKIYRCWRPCTHLSLQAFNRKRQYFQDKILDLRKHTLKEKRKSNQIVQSFIIRVPCTMECGTKRISSDASCVVCVLCIPYFAPSAEHL